MYTVSNNVKMLYQALVSVPTEWKHSIPSCVLNNDVVIVNLHISQTVYSCLFLTQCQTGYRTIDQMCYLA